MRAGKRGRMRVKAGQGEIRQENNLSNGNSKSISNNQDSLLDLPRRSMRRPTKTTRVVRSLGCLLALSSQAWARGGYVEELG